jgi:hypothetical protein
MLRAIFLFFGFAALFSSCFGQEEWQLKSDKDNIKTYSKSVPGSKINAVKVESVFTASLSQLVSALLDVASYDKWIYNSKSTRLLKQVSPSEVYYYSEVIFPWPTANRDFVSHVTVSQDIPSKTVRIEAINVAGWEPPKHGIVRIDRSEAKWIITPLANDKVRIEYELQTDPGGDLPAWLINPFASKGLVETFKHLREWLKNPQYTNAQLSFIVN